MSGVGYGGQAVLVLVLESGHAERWSAGVLECWSTVPSRNCIRRGGLGMLKGRQKFVEDLVRHPGRKTLLYRHLSFFVPYSQNYDRQAGRVPFFIPTRG